LELGAIFTQLDEENQESMVVNASQPNNQVEATCSSFEGECLAIVWAMATFQSYLFSNPFTLVIDHQPLKWFMESNQLTKKLAKWASFFYKYKFDVKY
jgi:hypothetical protein